MEDPQLLLSQWENDPNREIWVIDETKKSPPEIYKSFHKEIIVFSVIRLSAGEAVKALVALDRSRKKISDDDPNHNSFKSGMLWRALSNAQSSLTSYARSIISILIKCPHIVQLVTTLGVIERYAPNGALRFEDQNGALRTKPSKQLNLLQNLVIRLCNDWSIASPVDIIIDRADALGISPKQEKISKNQFNTYTGCLKKDGPNICLIAGSDDGPTFRDLLFLPDFFGYLCRKIEGPMLKNALSEVFSGDNPFVIVKYDLPSMLKTFA